MYVPLPREMWGLLIYLLKSGLALTLCLFDGVPIEDGGRDAGPALGFLPGVALTHHGRSPATPGGER